MLLVFPRKVLIYLTPIHTTNESINSKYNAHMQLIVDRFKDYLIVDITERNNLIMDGRKQSWSKEYFSKKI